MSSNVDGNAIDVHGVLDTKNPPHNSIYTLERGYKSVVDFELSDSIGRCMAHRNKQINIFNGKERTTWRTLGLFA